MQTGLNSQSERSSGGATGAAAAGGGVRRGKVELRQDLQVFSAVCSEFFKCLILHSAILSQFKLHTSSGP